MNWTAESKIKLERSKRTDKQRCLNHLKSPFQGFAIADLSRSKSEENPDNFQLARSTGNFVIPLASLRLIHLFIKGSRFLSTRYRRLGASAFQLNKSLRLMRSRKWVCLILFSASNVFLHLYLHSIFLKEDLELDPEIDPRSREFNHSRIMVYACFECQAK